MCGRHSAISNVCIQLNTTLFILIQKFTSVSISRFGIGRRAGVCTYVRSCIMNFDPTLRAAHHSYETRGCTSVHHEMIWLKILWVFIAIESGESGLISQSSIQTCDWGDSNEPTTKDGGSCKEKFVVSMTLKSGQVRLIINVHARVDASAHTVNMFPCVYVCTHY